MDPSVVAAHRLPDGELNTWNRNMSTDRTIYSESTNDGASVYTAKTNASTRSIKDKFRFIFRRKKKDDQQKSTRPRLEKKESNRLKKKPSRETIAQAKQDNPKLVWNGNSNRFSLDKDTGEVKDHTAMLHALVHRESMDSMPEYIEPDNTNKKPGEANIASLPPQLWQRITTFISLSDTANLALSTKTLLDKLGTESWRTINLPHNQLQRINFLMRMDRSVPNHLYCPLCFKYHLRTQNGKESLKPTLTLNPLFHCPLVETAPPRTRIASGRTLPFTFVQLALRGYKYGPQHGITLNSLARRWKEPETGWSHTTVYRVHNGHLIMRVVSQKFAEGGMVEAAKRGFYYNMYEDFTPYFSVCAHWRDGDLMTICKCAVDHIPPPRYAITEQHKMQKKALPQKPQIVGMCGTCQPMRRCPECPTEYLVEIKLVEDQKDPVYHFKQAVVVTRWSDLGDGTTPENHEWAACNGQAYYSSVIEIGRRAISGIFESKTSNDNMNIPGQRVISLNPKMEHKGEKGDKWY